MTIVFKQFHDAIIDQIAKKVPVYFTRYEDMTTDAEPTLTELFQLMLKVPSLRNTVIEQRIKKIASEGHSKRATYDLKSKSTLNRNACMYTEA